MKTGLDRVCFQPELMQDWGTCALVTHASTANSHREPCTHVLSRLHPKGQAGIACVFGPQHGYWQCEPYNMFETPDDVLELPSGHRLPLYSLYGEARQPNPQHLDGVDTIVVDLPDIGCRVYTYMSTLAGCLRVAAACGKRVVVLDRPNPLGLSQTQDSKATGPSRTEGSLIQPGLDSFVGWFRIPMRHGLTLGELGLLFCDQDGLQVSYSVVTAEGLTRSLFPADDLQAAQSLPLMASPNMPDIRSMILFPLAVALEGTNISEGRGTTAPFQMVGAPFLDENRLFANLIEASRRLNAFQTISFRPCRFMPRFDKFSGEICSGVLLERSASPSLDVRIEPTGLFRSAIALLAALACASGKNLTWREPGYEYNFTANPLDLILGSAAWRTPLEALRSNPHSEEAWATLTALCRQAEEEAAAFSAHSRRYWLYS